MNPRRYRALLGIILGLSIYALGYQMAFGAEWRGLTIAPENECSPYDDGQYAYDRPQIAAWYWMVVGAFFSPYDNGIYKYSEVDLEHRVARHQAHVSGLCAAPPQHRSKFASDVRNITWATPEINRVEKGDKDAAGWTPDLNKCHFAGKIGETKCNWQLTVDQAEADALEAILSKCPNITFSCRRGKADERWRPSAGTETVLP